MDIDVKVGREIVKVKENPLDIIVRWISPQAGNERMKARFAAAISGGYTGASKSRRSLKSWIAAQSDADSAVIGDLPDLRARSRDLIRNSPLAGGVINTNCTNVVGPGLRLKSEIDGEFLGLTDDRATDWEQQAERWWRLFSESPDCDITRTQRFPDLQDLVFRSSLESGDTFTLLPSRPLRRGFPFSLRIQVIEADRVENKDNVADTTTLTAGIQKTETGAPTHIHVLKQHPGNVEFGGTKEWTVIPVYGRRTGRRNVLHHYRKLRPGQSRGVPYLAPVLEAFKQLERYTNAELMAAVVAGMFTVFVKTEAGEELDLFEPNSETGASATDDDYKMGNGAVVSLGLGDDISIANPTRPNAGFDPFVQSVLRQIGVNLEIPYEILIKHFTASYSAARGAVMEAWRFFNARRDWLANSFCQPVYEAFIDEMVSSGKLVAPGYFADPLVRKAYLGAKWIGRPQGQIDPLKEMKANALAEDRGWKTATENTIELTGGDWGVKARQRAKENDTMIETGLKMDPSEMIEEDTQEENTDENP